MPRFLRASLLALLLPACGQAGSSSDGASTEAPGVPRKGDNDAGTTPTLDCRTPDSGTCSACCASSTGFGAGYDAMMADLATACACPVDAGTKMLDCQTECAPSCGTTTALGADCSTCLHKAIDGDSACYEAALTACKGDDACNAWLGCAVSCAAP